MKKLVISITMALAGALAAPAAELALERQAFNGGGGTSTNGGLAISGGFGQAGATQLTGGGYALSGGFCGLITVVATPGAPKVTLTRTATNTIVLSWPSNPAGWQIERATTLGKTPAWAVVPAPWTTNATTLSITTTATAGSQFYRLSKP